jgi:hypothetical protein
MVYYIQLKNKDSTDKQAFDSFPNTMNSALSR